MVCIFLELFDVVWRFCRVTSPAFRHRIPNSSHHVTLDPSLMYPQYDFFLFQLVSCYLYIQKDHIKQSSNNRNISIFSWILLPHWNLIANLGINDFFVNFFFDISSSTILRFASLPFLANISFCSDVWQYFLFSVLLVTCFLEMDEFVKG